MHKAEIHIVNRAGKVQYDQLHTAPASWSEMTREHLLIWAACMVSGRKVKEAKLILAPMLYKIPKNLFSCIKKSEIQPLVDSIDFLFKKNKLNNWLIPSIWSGIFKYYGPKNHLANLTIGEFEVCELCYEKYGSTANIEYLETLAGILYRPGRFYGIDDDIRVKLTTHGYIRRAKRFKKLPLGIKIAIYLNYEGCRNFLHEKYKEVFEGGGNVSNPLANKATKAQITPWSKIIESAANDIFGPLQATESTNLHKFLSRLGTRLKEARELEEKYRKK